MLLNHISVRFINIPHKIILFVIGVTLVTIGIFSFLIPPALFPDPANGFQVLRSMQTGSSFNVFTSPDQSDISQNYSEYITWWSPGQYLAPYFFQLFFNLNLGKAIAITITLSEFSGLAGLYFFFKKIGFSSIIATSSLVLIICQLAFFIPHVYYNGGETLLFAFEGWFLYGCASLNKTDLKLILFIVLSGWIGFFFKSSFIWVYFCGLCCLWIRVASQQPGILKWIKKGLWIGLPAILSLLTIYLLFLSRGLNPATTSKGLILTPQTLGFPLASPVLSGFSIDDLCNGLIYHLGKPVFNNQWSIIILILLALLSSILIYCIIYYVPKINYKVFILVFYCGSLIFFGSAYLFRLNISYEARHFRIIGLLFTPGLIYLLARLKVVYQLFFVVLIIGIACCSINYTIKGYQINNSLTAKGVTGVSQPNIDQLSLDHILELDKKSRNATFVFVSNDIGLEVIHNRIITLQPIGNDLIINQDDYRYEGHAGPLYILLPENYNGPKEKMILKAFPGYKGFNVSMLSDNYVLYSAQ